MCRQYLLTYLLIVTFYSLLNYVYFIVFCWTYDMYICKNLMVFIMSSKHCMLMNMVCIGICFKSRFFNVIFTMLCGSAPFHTCYVKKNGKILRIRHYLFLIFGNTGKVRQLLTSNSCFLFFFPSSVWEVAIKTNIGSHAFKTRYGLN